MKKNVLFLAAALLLSFTACNANVNTGVGEGAGVVDSGKCGANIIWTVTEVEPYKMKLSFEGSGEMYQLYDSFSVPLLTRNILPWSSYVPFIREISIDEGITSICNWAFWDMTNVKEIKLPSTLETIGGCVFECMTGLKKLEIPESVKLIEPFAFKYMAEECKINFAVTEGWMQLSESNWNDKTKATPVEQLDEVVNKTKTGSGIGIFRE